MKTHSKSLFLTSVLLLSAAGVTFAQGTAFTYQGRLNDGPNPAAGNYDLQFYLRDALVAGNPVGGTNTLTALGVSDGLFTTTLDFGADVFTGADRWLEIGVRTNGGGAFTALTPRQQLTPTPYAITASNLTGLLPAAQLSGTLPSSQLGGTYSSALTLNNAANSFTGNGSGLVDLNPEAILWGSSQPWNVRGNAGTTPGTNFLGTTDSQDLWLKVNNQVGWRLLRSSNSATEPNIAGGGLGNQIFSGATGSGIAAGNNNTILANVSYATISGGDHNTISNANESVIGGGGFNRIAFASFATIAGGGSNSIPENQYPALYSANYASIGGGYGNGVWGRFGTISGGNGNVIRASYPEDQPDKNPSGATIGGGSSNSIFGGLAVSHYATISGGSLNSVDDSPYATIAGGHGNFQDGKASYGFIGGGQSNWIGYNTFWATIGGGIGNRAWHDGVTIAGGRGNVAGRPEDGGSDSTIGGGANNRIGHAGYSATIAGGQDNRIESFMAAIGGGVSNLIMASSATIAGGRGNVVWGESGTISGGEANVIRGTEPTKNPTGATIGGGSSNTISGGLAVSHYATISGGSLNWIDDSPYATIAGGHRNFQDHRAYYGSIGGGQSNWVGGLTIGAMIGGGIGNFAMNDGVTIAGGRGNVAGISESGVSDSTIGGGKKNRIGASSSATIAGGEQNNIGFIANGAAIGGGWSNVVEHSAEFASIGGGMLNTNSAAYATIPGGAQNLTDGDYSFAAGRRAGALHRGAFVWADSTDADFDSTAINEVSFRCGGGVRFASGSGGGNQTVSWTPGAASWSFSSDRNLKEAITPVDGGVVLEKVSRLPINEWRYKGFPQRHVGPMAQDFHAAFPLNESDTTLNDADLHGVALAAIQGLNQKVEEKDARIAELERRLEKLERMMNRENGGAK